MKSKLASNPAKKILCLALCAIMLIAMLPVMWTLLDLRKSLSSSHTKSRKRHLSNPPTEQRQEKRRARIGNLFFPGFRRKRTRPQGSIGKGRNPKKSKALIVNSGCSVQLKK